MNKYIHIPIYSGPIMHFLKMFLYLFHSFFSYIHVLYWYVTIHIAAEGCTVHNNIDCSNKQLPHILYRSYIAYMITCTEAYTITCMETAPH